MLTILELDPNPIYLEPLKKLLIEYGRYMYDDLRLIAGKETFYNDLKTIPGTYYSSPLGSWLLGFLNNELVGCVAIKHYGIDTCEMKRMFIEPKFRGKGFGRQLCNAVFEKASEMGYKTVLLDTNCEMKEAVSLYLSCGFQAIPPYCINENENPLYMAYDIN